MGPPTISAVIIPISQVRTRSPEKLNNLWGAQLAGGGLSALTAHPLLATLLCSSGWGHPTPGGGTHAGLTLVTEEKEGEMIKYLPLPRHSGGRFTEPPPPPSPA